MDVEGMFVRRRKDVLYDMSTLTVFGFLQLRCRDCPMSLGALVHFYRRHFHPQNVSNGKINFIKEISV